MTQTIPNSWHFPIMIIASVLVFFLVIRIAVGKQSFLEKRYVIILLAIIIVIFGMLFGKYGSNWGLKWWVYYPIPMLLNVFLPPIVLKMNGSRTLLYLVLSFLSAPLIHIFFSVCFGWNEYMPFWQI
jgi:hypothetical protein